MDEPPFSKGMLSQRERVSPLEFLVDSYTHPVQRDYLIASGVGIAAGAAALYATGIAAPAKATLVSSAVLHSSFFITQWVLTHLREHDDPRESLKDATMQNVTNAPGVLLYNTAVLLLQGGLTALTGDPIWSFVSLNAAGTLLTRPSHHYTHQKYENWRSRRDATTVEDTT